MVAWFLKPRPSWLQQTMTRPLEALSTVLTTQQSIAGIQLCKAENVKAIYVTASTQKKIDFCKSVGATEGFSYKDEKSSWSKQLLEYTDGKGADLIIDFVGASYFDQNLDAAAKDGRIVNLGFLGGVMVKDINIARFLLKRLRFEGSSLRSRDEEYQGRLVSFVHFRVKRGVLCGCGCGAD